MGLDKKYLVLILGGIPTTETIMTILTILTCFFFTYAVGIFVGYIWGYDRADRDNNDGYSTRTPWSMGAGR